MKSALAILSIIFQAFWKWWSVREEQANENTGAALQRDADNADQNKRVSDATIATDNVRSGNGVSLDKDPFNRDNAPKGERTP